MINLENKIEIIRPDKTETFMDIAFACAKQSPDAQTKYGCVIVDKCNRILGTGYNGFPRDVDNSKLPNLRPDKYPFMFHSEHNAVLNCRVLPKFAGGGTAYVTGICCANCLMILWHSGVDEVYQYNHLANMMNNTQDEIKNAFLALVPMKTHIISGEENFR